MRLLDANTENESHPLVFKKIYQPGDVCAHLSFYEPDILHQQWHNAKI